MDRRKQSKASLRCSVKRKTILSISIATPAQTEPSLNYLKGYADGTLQENCEKFLLDIGITEEEIASIKATLLE